jgi:hypothetical protein
MSSAIKCFQGAPPPPISEVNLVHEGVVRMADYWNASSEKPLGRRWRRVGFRGPPAKVLGGNGDAGTRGLNKPWPSGGGEGEGAI